ncbi:MAG: rhodanese-like domain-containing protein [Candidatus Dormibacteria bacterium]
MSSIREILAAIMGDGGAAAPKSIKPADVATELAVLQLIDVREAGEWKARHVDGARHIPLGRLEQSIASIDPSRRVAVICHRGMRSQKGAAILRAHSIEAVSVSGGMLAWERAGLPTVTGADSRAASR